MSDSITVSGTIATDPRHVVAEGNIDITSFRLASPQRYWDRKRGAFVENEAKMQLTPSPGLELIGAVRWWQSAPDMDGRAPDCPECWYPMGLVVRAWWCELCGIAAPLEVIAFSAYTPVVEHMFE